MSYQQTRSTSKSRVVLWTCLAVPCMFAFGFALVPLYNLICDVTGINGKVETVAYALQETVKIDTSRQVDMQFVVIKNGDMTWDFATQEKTLTMHPGEMYTIQYAARNPTNSAMTAQMIPSVSPGVAAQYVHKIQCFCFDSQTLDAGEEKEFVVRLFIDPNIPKDIQQVTLAYTIFDVSDNTQ